MGRSAQQIRDEHAARAAREAAKHVKKVPIRSLVPYEASVVGPALADARRKLDAGGAALPRVVQVGDDLMVLDGTHRVRALADSGVDEVEVTVETCPPDARDRYQKTIDLRKLDGTTIESLPTDEDEEARTRRTQAELINLGLS